MTESKKAWVRQLIVLVRNKPEEAVLSACKSSFAAGPWEFLSYCDEQGWGGCNEITSS